MTQPPLAPGWYPDPADPSRNIYWNGSTWGNPATPATNSTQNATKEKAVAFGVCALAAIGLIISMQSVSLLTGTGSLWTGVAITAVGTAAAFFLGASKLVRILASICLALALVNAVYMENQLSQRRSEIFNN